MARYTSGDFYLDRYPPLAIILETPARTDFNATRDDGITLIRIHDEKIGKRHGYLAQELDALKRSALILAVTAWESFVEDTVTAELEKGLTAARKPSDLDKVFNGVAVDWPNAERSPKRFGPELAQWTGEEWKDQIRDSLAKTLETFHTPNSKNTSQLFKKYLDIKIDESWSWTRINSTTTRKKLDDLVKLRGRIVHRGRRIHPISRRHDHVTRKTVVDALNLVYSLVDATEKRLGNAPTVKSAIN